MFLKGVVILVCLDYFSTNVKFIPRFCSRFKKSLTLSMADSAAWTPACVVLPGQS
jgi:hypothetical protein